MCFSYKLILISVFHWLNSLFLDLRFTILNVFRVILILLKSVSKINKKQKQKNPQKQLH